MSKHGMYGVHLCPKPSNQVIDLGSDPVEARHRMCTGSPKPIDVRRHQNPCNQCGTVQLARSLRDNCAVRSVGAALCRTSGKIAQTGSAT